MPVDAWSSSKSEGSGCVNEFKHLSLKEDIVQQSQRAPKRQKAQKRCAVCEVVRQWWHGRGAAQNDGAAAKLNGRRSLRCRCRRGIPSTTSSLFESSVLKGFKYKKQFLLGVAVCLKE